LVDVLPWTVKKRLLRITNAATTKTGGRKPPVDHGNALATTMLHMRETADAASADRIAITVTATSAG